jgi:hypothetical protein
MMYIDAAKKARAMNRSDDCMMKALQAQDLASKEHDQRIPIFRLRSVNMRMEER